MSKTLFKSILKIQDKDSLKKNLEDTKIKNKKLLIVYLMLYKPKL